MSDVTWRKREILSKIEYACIHLIEQLVFLNGRTPKVLTLRVSDNEASKQNHYRVRNMNKLAFNICTLSQIYRLVSSNLHSTKRDLYYDLKSMYKVQTNIDRSITAICELLNESRVSLHVLSCSKGILSGNLCFITDDESLIDCKAQPLLLYETLTECRVISSAEFILIVEKDATFQKLVDENFFKLYPKSILVTGKGYPDICTRQVLLWLVKQLKIPVFGIFDADPHGMEIMLTYKYGAMTEKAESKGAFLQSLEWIGLLPSDSQLFPVAENQRLPLVNRDFVKITRLRRRAELLGESDVVRQCDFLREMRYKLELEAMSSISFQFLARVYLQPKLKEARNKVSLLQSGYLSVSI